MSKRKLKILTIAEKVNVINMVERSGKKNYEVAYEFGIPSSTLSTILKNKTKILTNFELQPSRKKMKLSEFPNLDSSLLKWFIQCKDSNAPISGPILKEKADVFAKSLGYFHFKNSSGWLDKWKKRNNIVFRKPYGERVQPANKDQRVTIWKKYLSSDVCKDYSPDDIFCANETGMLFKLLPDCTDKGLVREDCSGGKRSKERVTVLLCTNMSGTEKLTPLIIGNSLKPRCFEGIKSLPVDYESNPKSWMTASMWNKWLEKFDTQLSTGNRKIILFIDNCTLHTIVPNLKSITVKYIPANVPLKLQPLDLGIIQNFKMFYRKEIIQKITSSIELQQTFSVDLLQAVRIIDKAWRLVATETIINCFKKAGFSTSSSLIQTTSNDESQYEKNIPEWSYISNQFNLKPEDTFNNYVKIDENLPICGDLTDSEIVSEVTGIPRSVNDTSGSDTDECPILKKITINEATKALEVIRSFIETTEGTIDKLYLFIEQNNVCFYIYFRNEQSSF